MIRLHGFPVSNYVNMVHWALLEKGIDFEYAQAFPDQTGVFLARSPRGKVPCLETEHGFLSEASVILEYLEQRFPERPLLPADAFGRAKIREMMKTLELYVELPARTCYVESFFGGKVSDEVKALARRELRAGFASMKRQGRFAPFLMGPELTLADLMFQYSANNAAVVGRKVLGVDLLDGFDEASALMARLNDHPHVRTIAARRAAAMPGFVAAMTARFATKA